MNKITLNNMKKIRYTAWLAGLISLLVLSQAPLATLHAAEPVWGTSPIAEPYPYVSTGSFSGPAVPESPDPLVAYRWPKPKATDGLEIYLQKPSAVSSDTKESFDNLGSLTTDHPKVTVNGSGSIRMDFGAELPAWVEFDSPDCPGDVEMSISEYNQPGPEKTKAPVKHGNTYRLELNAELYEGVRFAWIHVKAPAKPWHITGIRAVCQVKPTNYDGSFSCSDPMLTKAWYMSAYGVKACLVSNYFSSILLERGDRIPWVGDAPASQAAGLVAFGNSDFVKANIDLTAGGNNGIIAYSLYWVIGLLDYYQYTGDASMMEKYLKATCEILDHSYQVYGTNPKLKFFGWDERVGTGFEIWYRGGSGAQEAQNAYQMLSLRMWSDFAAAMGAYGRADLQAKYNGYAEAKMAELRKNRDWHSQFGMHALAEVAASGLLNDVERKAIAEKEFLDRVTRLSFDPFCQLFINQAMARMNLYDEAFTSIKDVWGGIIKLGGTTPWECYRPSWNSGVGVGDPVPNSQSGITSLCHPWGAGPVKWLNEEVLGIKPTTPGFKTFDVVPHLGRSLARVAGKTPTPHGEISASFDVNTGKCKVTAPAGTIGRIGIPKVEKTISAIAVNGTKAWDGVYHAVTGIGSASQDSEFVYLSSVQPGTYSIEVSYSGNTPEYKEPPEKYAAQFKKHDKTTAGDWGGVYGKDGYVLCNYKGDRNDGKALPTRLIRGEREEVILDIRNDEKALPSYVTSLEYFRAFPKSGMPDPQMWAAETADKRALAPDKHNGSNRKAAGYSNSGETMSVTIGIDGEREYQVALYFVDWNKTGCRQAVEMMDAETLNQIAPVKIVDDFSGGAYLVYQYNKSAKFRINKVRGPIASLSGIFFDPASVEGTTMKLLNGVQQRWTEDKANAWYQQQPWLVGCNFVPSTAVNAIEMWQTETFDPVTIERELGWAKQLGFNTVRVFHNFVVWKADADGLKKRFDQFLAIASKLGIRAMPVLFDDCNFAGGIPHPGKQPEPTPLVHNSQWVGSPPPAMVSDMNAWPELERYVKDMVTSFKNDPRIVIWDLYNEPSAVGSDLLLAASFRWARACSPAQPLTFGAWEGWNKYTDAIIAQSDVISFHCYASKDGVLGRITDLKKHGRPVICSEWMSRPAGSRFDIDLPMFKKEQVGCYQWGLVNGRTQTHLVMHDPREPVLWQHDLLRRDGTPYSPAEIYAIKHATGIIATPPATLVPTSEDRQITWSFTTDTPAGEWSKPGFDESAWKKGKAPFASNDRKPTTEWKSADIWIRRVIELPAEVKGLVALRIQYDDEAEVYLNGIFAARLSGYIANYALHSITPEARASLQPGRNLVAIHCHNKAGGQFVDAGLVLLDEGKPEKSIGVLSAAAGGGVQQRWTEEKARDWYNKQPWLVGCNFLPSTAVNDVEMWQAETFDPKTIDRELGMAEELGLNSVRVFLNYVVWKADPDGLKKRFEQFLEIADKHGISVMPIFFDDCAFAGKEPKVGKQDDPVPGVHNSGWVPSPGKSRVLDRTCWPDLEKYVKDMVGSFRNDRRIIIWDLYNEPANDGMGEKSRPLMEAVFAWAREMKPVQPLTVGAWSDFNAPIQRRMMELSDVISFHGYDKPADMEGKIKICAEYGRPVICTEWLLRQGNNKIENILPMFHGRRIGCYNWGFVAGRTQTYFQWGSKKGAPEPDVWQHDIFRADGMPYNADETAIIKHLTGRLKVSSEKSSFRGWNSQRLGNGLVELQIVPEIGGRVIQLTMGNKDFLWVNPQLAGKLPPEGGVGPDNEWLNYGGDKLWPAPQGWDNAEQWPGPPDAVLDGGAYKMKVLSSGGGKASVMLTSGKDKRSGIQFSRVISVYDGSTRVSFEATMKNIDTKPRRWGIWAITQLDGGKKGGGCNTEMNAYCPLNPKSHFTNGYSVIFGDEKNPSFQSDAAKNLMRVQYQYKVGKIGLDSPAGWVATVDGASGKVFVQRFVFEADKSYPENSSVEFWLNGLGSFKAWGKDNVMPDDPVKNPYVFESEVLSPFAKLQPGENYTWKYDWYLTSIGAGKSEVVDCTSAGVVAEPLSAKVENGKIRLKGRFGVFAQGTLVVVMKDAQGKVVERNKLIEGVFPVIPVVLDHAVAMPAGTASVSLVLVDGAGTDTGKIAEAAVD